MDLYVFTSHNGVPIKIKLKALVVKVSQQCDSQYNGDNFCVWLYIIIQTISLISKSYILNKIRIHSFIFIVI